MNFVIKLLGNMAGIWLASVIVSGIALPTSSGFLQAFGVLAVIALIFTLVNMLVRPLLKVVTFPIYVLTFGLFALVVNALMFSLTGWLSTQIGFGLAVSGFWSAVFGAIITAIVASIVTGILDAVRK